MTKASLEWTDKKIERLKALIADGMRGNALAEALGMSRSAVCGKIFRLGLDIAVVPSVAGKAGVRRRGRPSPLRLEPPKIIELEIKPDEPKPLGDVVGGCCWIRPAPPKRLFCGHPTVDGTWCEHHHARVYPSRAKQAGAA